VCAASSGGTPAEAEATIRARGVRPWRSTASPLATTMAEAPSESGDAVPADLLADMREVFPAAELRVLYGPTEATIICSS